MKHNALLIMAAFLLATPPAMAEETLVRSISVRGEAKEEIAPDQAILSGQLVSRSKQLADAKQQNDKMVERIVAVAKQFDIPKEKVSASNVYISPDYSYNQQLKKQELVGYVVTRQLSITMDKLDIHEQVLSALVENNIDQISGVQFAVSDAEKRGDALKVKAVENARMRAEMLATAAGAKLGRVISINSDGAVMQPQPMMMRAMKAPMGGMAESSVAPSLPGLSTLHESISVSYELE